MYLPPSLPPDLLQKMTQVHPGGFGPGLYAPPNLPQVFGPGPVSRPSDRAGVPTVDTAAGEGAPFLDVYRPPVMGSDPPGGVWDGPPEWKDLRTIYKPPGMTPDPRAEDLGTAKADATEAMQGGADAMQEVEAQEAQIRAQEEQIQARKIAQQQQARLRRQKEQLQATGAATYEPPPEGDARAMQDREQQAMHALAAMRRSQPIKMADGPEAQRRAVEMMPQPVRQARPGEAPPPPRVAQMATRMARMLFNTDTAHPVRRIASDDVMLKLGELPSGIVNPVSLLGIFG